MDLGLKGKKVIMNGGAHGLGLQALKLFAAEGADVAFFSRKEDKIEAAKADLLALGVTEEQLKALDKQARKTVSEAADFAENSPEPDLSELHTDVLVERY